MRLWCSVVCCEVMCDVWRKGRRHLECCYHNTTGRRGWASVGVVGETVRCLTWCRTAHHSPPVTTRHQHLSHNCLPLIVAVQGVGRSCWPARCCRPPGDPDRSASCDNLWWRGVPGWARYAGAPPGPATHCTGLDCWPTRPH